MRSQRFIPLWADVVVLAAVAAAMVGLGRPLQAAEEEHRVGHKPQSVSNVGDKFHKIDYNDEEEVAPESITTPGGTITIVSKTFRPPTDAWSFKPFPVGNTHVDIYEDDPPDGMARHVVAPAKDNDTDSRVKVEMVATGSVAAQWPLRCEGNLNPPAGAPGAPPHWSAKVTKQKFDLIVHNGLDGPEVSEENEVKVGAFSVANLNDTDSDGRVEKDETGADAENQIANEKDMIKVIIKKVTDETIAGSVTLEMTGDGTKVKLWKKQTKEGGVVNQREWAIADIPADGVVRWIEGLDKSAAVRDIAVVLKKKGAGGGFADGAELDKANLTFVWATQTGVEHDRKTAAQLLAADAWKNMTDPPKRHFTGAPPPFAGPFDGTGLLPINLIHGARNLIVNKFKVEPANVWKEPGVKFDVTRQSAGKLWLKVGNNWGLEESRTFPTEDEKANDDLYSWDESPSPNASDEMFAIDAPGVGQDAFGDVLWWRANFREYIRVRFDGTKPSGNSIDGSRCSERYDWHMRHRLLKDGTKWKRDSGDAPESGTNDIGPTHIEVGDPS